MTETLHITSIWSSFGHTFLSDGGGTESCLTCGALYQLVADTDMGPGSGRYVNAHGEDPAQCTGDTEMAHGYPGERVCSGWHSGPDHDPVWGHLDIRECEDERCPHSEHTCSCIRCDS